MGHPDDFVPRRYKSRVVNLHQHRCPVYPVVVEVEVPFLSHHFSHSATLTLRAVWCSQPGLRTQRRRIALPLWGFPPPYFPQVLGHLHASSDGRICIKIRYVCISVPVKYVCSNVSYDIYLLAKEKNILSYTYKTKNTGS